MYNEELQFTGEALMFEPGKNWNWKGWATVHIPVNGHAWVTFESETNPYVDGNSGDIPFPISNNIYFDVKADSKTIKVQNCHNNNELYYPAQINVIENNTNPIKYWRIALLNLVTDFSDAQNALPGLQDEFIDNSHAILFDFQQIAAYIQPLIGYEVLCEELRTSRTSAVVTAVATGQFANFNPTDPCQDIPDSIVSLLTAFTVSKVGLYRIELLDERFNIIQNIYWKTSKPVFRQSHVAINSPISIGELLTSFLASSHYGKTPFWKALEEIGAIGLEQMDLNETFRSAYLALDILIEYAGLGHTSLTKTLSSTLAMSVQQILKDSAKSLRSINNVSTEEKMKVARIADKVQNYDIKELSFGLSVKALLQKHKQPDARVLDVYYGTRGGNQSWVGTVDMYRGDSAHKDYFLLSKGSRSTQELWSLRNHLHDIALRIVLTMLNYKGKYKSPIIGQHELVSTTWVKERLKQLYERNKKASSQNMPLVDLQANIAASLGYSRPPQSAHITLKKC